MTTGSPPGELSAADRVALMTVREALLEARRCLDVRPPFTVIAGCLDELGVALPGRSRRPDIPDPFLDLEPPAKPQQEADWLTPGEFGRLLAAAGQPRRRRPGLAERDQLVLLALVATGLRRSELLALNWQDLELES